MADNDIDDGLTDEERAALAEDEETTDTAENEGGENAEEDTGAGDGEPDDDAAGADASEAAADDADPAADTEAGKAETAEKQESESPDSAPLLVVEPPADAQARLTEIATKKEDLFTKFDDGDITAKEYQKELDALAKQEREIEWGVEKAKLAGEMEAQRQSYAWKLTVDSFIRENVRYDPEKSPSMYKLLDLEVRRVAVTDEFKGRTDAAAGREILAKANENLAKDLGFDVKPKVAANKPAGNTPEPPPSLHKVPASEINDTSGGKYAVLDRLAGSDPIGYEEALMKLSDAERNSYLSA